MTYFLTRVRWIVIMGKEQGCSYTRGKSAFFAIFETDISFEDEEEGQ